jgi:hypothetical protein
LLSSSDYQLCQQLINTNNQIVPAKPPIFAEKIIYLGDLGGSMSHQLITQRVLGRLQTAAAATEGSFISQQWHRREESIAFG